MTQRDVVQVIGAIVRTAEAMGEPQEVREQAREQVNTILRAALDAMAFEGVDADEIARRILGERSA